MWSGSGATAGDLSIYIRNNIFYESTGPCLWVQTPTMGNITIDYNLYYPGADSGYHYAYLNQNLYTPNDFYGNFSWYQAVTGKDAHSIAADPQFVDEANGNYHLRKPRRRSMPARIPGLPRTTMAPPGPREPAMTSAPTNTRPCPW